ncbi:MAG: ABC transporter [Verrucomicrobiia bacterium Tous-C4TDCM]|jgi:lipoprotein-releasing system ATP-binding protein|nr:MAG: ABC transporter [Verrucomicrobiae bacterium Tous-C4TDCM]
MVEIKDVWKSFDRGRIEVLKGVDLKVRRGETVALCGTSGCGKSTLLNVIAGLEDADRGSVRTAGRTIGSERERVDLLRHDVGFVFQLHHLMPDLTLEENCLVPVIAAGGRKADAMKRLSELAEATGITHQLKQRVRELSGGERQRGALVRSLMNEPDLLLGDEPTGALDEANRERVFAMLLDLVRAKGRTLVMATHDLDLAMRCDRVIRMRDGRIVSDAA